jgi:hypothetical protein
MTLSTNPSRQSVMKEFAKLLLAEAQRAATIFGTGVDRQVLGLAKTDDLPEPDAIDLSRFELARSVALFYDYAFEARCSVGLDLGDLQVFFEHFENFIKTSSEIRELYLDDTGTSSVFCEHLVNLTRARLDLDDGQAVDIADVALLANMNEKSVRNATNAKEWKKLRVRRESAHGGRIWVENDEARRWLAGTRGFKPTLFPTLADDAIPETLNSGFEIGRFVLERRKALQLSLLQVASKLPVGKNSENWLRSFETTGEGLDPGVCRPLSRALNVDAVWFTRQVFKALFPEEWEVIHCDN